MSLEEMREYAQELRVGSPGKEQRAALYGVLTRAILAIEDIPVPWLDDCIYDALQSVNAVRDAIPRD